MEAEVWKSAQFTKSNGLVEVVKADYMLNPRQVGLVT